MRLPLLALILACDPQPSAEPPTAQDSAYPEPQVILGVGPFNMDEVSEDPEYLTQALAAVAVHIEYLPEDERQALTEAARDLATNCPYSRAGFGASLLLDQQLAQLDGSDLPEHAQRRLAELQLQVGLHARIVRAMGGGDLSMPLPSDYLFSVLDLDDATSLLARPDAVQRTRTRIAGLPELVDRMPVHAQHRIAAAREIVDPHMGRMWLHYGVMERWSRELHTVSAELAPGEQSERLEELSLMLLDFMQGSC